MSDENQIVVSKAPSNFNMGMLKKVRGLAENSPLRRINSGGEPRLTVDGNQFQIKKGGKVMQTIKDGKKPAKELDVVIHYISPVIQQQAAFKFDPKNPRYEPVGCWSNDGNRPDDDCWNAQGQHCDTCKLGGGNEVVDKASSKVMKCGLTRLAVVSLYTPTQEPEQYYLMNFNWSSNSTKKAGEDMDEQLYCLINYLTMLADNEVETHRIVTRLVVDDWSDPKNNSKLLFQPIDIVQEEDPNYLAHVKWEAQFEAKDKRFEDLVKITQHKPRDFADDLPASGVEASSDEGEEESEETPAQKKKRLAAEKAAATKEKAKKAAALKKKREEEAKAKAAAEAEEEEEEVDIDELDDVDELDEEDDPDEDELVEEDDDDFGDLDDLLAED